MPTSSTPASQLIPLYRAWLNEHPYSWDMLTALNQSGVKGLLHPSSDLKRQDRNSDDMPGYQPTSSVSSPYPKTEFDFSADGTYSIYNWEIFFHQVSLIARQLRQNNQYAEAIRWLGYVFDPTEPENPSPNQLYDKRYWQIKPFFNNLTEGSIQNMIRLLSANNLTPAEVQLRQQYEAQIAAWRRDPFDPHVIAALRNRAYMLWTVMEYVTTLADWGDYLFRQFTMESINEAINLYIMASEILGPRPRQVERPTPAPVAFDDIMTNLSAFSDVLVSFENRMTAMNVGICPATESEDDSRSTFCPSRGTATTITDLLFCVPDNPQLTAMWDRVEDRLFKIRHCMDIDGKIRELALFSPPIDPALLVQAAAAGLSIQDALADLAAPLPYYRFNYLLQKANEFCNEVKGLGSQLLSLLEKKDAEELALFRQVHEQNILKAARALKQMAIDEANENRKTLESSKNLIQIRLDDYKARPFKNSREDNALKQTQLADTFMYAEQGVRLIAGLLNLIPDLYTGASGLGPHIVGHLTGGQKFSVLTNAGASALGLISSVYRNKASTSLTYAGYDRRQEDWNLQIKSATEELAQVDRQLVAADIRVAVAEKDLANHDLQVSQSQEMYDFLKNKYTNNKLYAWMVGQVKTVYHQAFDLAYNMSKRAQVCYDHELGTSATNIIAYGQWDSTKSGLLAGERLAVQLKQLDDEYIKNNQREYELSKNISLALLDPMALETLKATGSCDIYIPEMLFDLDHPSHYFRRIKSVSLSIPCIAGSNTNINATLTLQSHGIRKVTTGTYTFTNPQDPGFGESIATSSSQNDGGVFEMNFRDERYLPFESKGAVSKWTLDISQIKKTGLDVIRLFDFNTIADVVVHMKYTAREGGASFSDKVRDNIDSALGATADMFNSGSQGMLYAFSLKHDMPNAWYEFRQNGDVNFIIDKSRLPYLMQALNPVLSGVTFVVDSAATLTSAKMTLTGTNAPTGTDNVSLALISNTPQPIKAYSGSATLTSATILGGTYNIATGTNLNKINVNDIVIVAKLNVSW